MFSLMLLSLFYLCVTINHIIKAPIRLQQLGSLRHFFYICGNGALFFFFKEVTNLNIFCLISFFRSYQQPFIYVGTGLPVLIH